MGWFTRLTSTYLARFPAAAVSSFITQILNVKAVHNLVLVHLLLPVNPWSWLSLASHEVEEGSKYQVEEDNEEEEEGN